MPHCRPCAGFLLHHSPRREPACAACLFVYLLVLLSDTLVLSRVQTLRDGNNMLPGSPFYFDRNHTSAAGPEAAPRAQPPHRRGANPSAS